MAGLDFSILEIREDTRRQMIEVRLRDSSSTSISNRSVEDHGRASQYFPRVAFPNVAFPNQFLDLENWQAVCDRNVFDDVCNITRRTSQA